MRGHQPKASQRALERLHSEEEDEAEYITSLRRAASTGLDQDILHELIVTASTNYLLVYLEQIPSAEIDRAVELLFAVPLTYRDLIAPAIVRLLERAGEDTELSQASRVAVRQWFSNGYFRPKKLLPNSPYVTWLIGSSAADVIGEEIVDEFIWVLGNVDCQSASTGGVFPPLGEISPAIVGILQDQNIIRDCPFSGKPLIFWVMYHLVDRGQSGTTWETLYKLAQDYEYDREVIRDYYPAEACERISGEFGLLS